MTARELEKFLKKRKLTMEELSFVAKGEGIGERQDQVDYSSQDSRVVLDGKGNPGVTVNIQGMIFIESSDIHILVQVML